LSRLRFEAGADDALALLQTEQTRIELEDAAVQAQASRATALAALYKAVAGDFAEADGAGGAAPGTPDAPDAEASP